MKEQFPIFSHSKDLVYLDSAATTHKPASVIKAISSYYGETYATVHRGMYSMAFEATSKVEEARAAVARFINCEDNEVIFTHSATEAVNLLAYTYGEQNIAEGDEVLVCIAEHHSNYLPWKELCRRKGASFVTFYLDEFGRIDLKGFKNALSPRTKIVAVAHESNVLGIVNPVKEIASLTHSVGAVLIVDGAQAIAHQKVDVKALDADFYLFSGHKMYGPTGVGVLYGKYEILESMPPFHTGGGMVEEVKKEASMYRKPPYKFEAGTPMIASILGLQAAIEFIEEVTFKKIVAGERLLSYLLYDGLKDHVNFLTPLCRGSSILSFTVDGLHPTDVAMMLSLDNVAVRTGNMCAQPFLKYLGKPDIVRVSLGIYNDEKDIHRCISSLTHLQQTK